MKSYYGKQVSMFILPRDGKVQVHPGNLNTYTPDDVFVEATTPKPDYLLPSGSRRAVHPHRDRPAGRDHQ